MKRLLFALLFAYAARALAAWTLPSSSVAITPGSGATFGGHVPPVGSALHQAVVAVDHTGQMLGSKQHYVVMSDVVSFGRLGDIRPLALYNGSSTGVIVEIEALFLQRDVSSFALTSHDFCLRRINSLGNTANAFTRQNTAVAMDPRNATLPASLIILNQASSSIIGAVSSLWPTTVGSDIGGAYGSAPLWPPYATDRRQWQAITCPPGYGFDMTSIKSTVGNFRVGLIFAISSGP